MKRLRHVIVIVSFFSLLFLAFFSPVLLQGNLLAFGVDGLQNYLPFFYSHKTLWDTLLFGGFPMLADPQVMTWYPPAALLSQLPGMWNVFMILAYVAGSCFMYGYVYRLTSSRMAGLTSGITFGLSGFMVAHITHAIIIQTAIWFPLIIWSLESQRSQRSNAWLLIGSLGVTLSLLGGQPQISAYGLILSAAYAATRGWTSPRGKLQFYFSFWLMIAMGLGLPGFQFIPTAD